MAADTLNNLVKNRENIRRIMRMDSNGQMKTMLESAIKSGRISYDQDGMAVLNQQSSPMQLNEQTGTQANTVVVNEEVMKKSKLPLAVLESFKENPGIPVQSGIPTPPASVLDGLGLETLEQLRNENVHQDKETMVTESHTIDYSLLRTIINEAVQENVKKYVSSMCKKLISEGVGSGQDNMVQAVKIGNKFSFITENGDVYEATLQYKTNISEQTSKKKTKKVL
jgi:hypothetical protein